MCIWDQRFRSMIEPERGCVLHIGHDGDQHCLLQIDETDESQRDWGTLPSVTAMLTPEEVDAVVAALVVARRSLRGG